MTQLGIEEQPNTELHCSLILQSFILHTALRHEFLNDFVVYYLIDKHYVDIKTILTIVQQEFGNGYAPVGVLMIIEIGTTALNRWKHCIYGCQVP